MKYLLEIIRLAMYLEAHEPLSKGERPKRCDVKNLFSNFFIA